MLDTSSWPEIDLDVLKDVHLDPTNVRLETADLKVEADIIQDLFANEDALGLVEGICKVGYLTHERPVVLMRSGNYIMVEGNRRLAALKAIQNPMLVPDYQARVSTLVTLVPDRTALATVRAMVAPSQAEADQLIAAIHTGNLRKPWSPSRQAAFFQAQINAGRTLRELITRYPTIDVRKFVFRAHIVNLFRSVHYDDAELQDYLATKKWARGLSTLARIYESREFLDLTGLSMDEAGDITMTLSSSAFKGVATAIVRGMYEENINTRSLNSVSSPRYTQLLKELRQIAADAGSASSQPGQSAPSPGPSNRGGSPSPTVGSVPGSLPPPVAASSIQNSPPSGRTRKSRTLDLGQIKPDASYPAGLKLLLGELSEIDVPKYPNATFLIIRAVLEKSIKAFAEAKSIDIKSTGNSQNGYVQLHNALKWLLEYVKANGPTYLIQVIEGIRTGKIVTYTSTADALNATNHNHHFLVDRDQVFAMWDSIDSLMKYLMKP